MKLLENKLALSPTSADAMPNAFWRTARLSMTFKIAKSATGIVLKPEVASDPAALASSAAGDTSRQLIAADASTQTLKVTDTAVPADAPRRFMRLMLGTDPKGGRKTHSG